MPSSPCSLPCRQRPDLQERSRRELSVGGHDADAARLFGDEHARVVRAPGDGDRAVEAGHDRRERDANVREIRSTPASWSGVVDVSFGVVVVTVVWVFALDPLLQAARTSTPMTTGQRRTGAG